MALVVGALLLSADATIAQVAPPLYQVEIGYNAHATQVYATAIGAHSSAPGVAATAIGESCKATGTNAFVAGFASGAHDYCAVAIGGFVNAYAFGSTALGVRTAAKRPGELAHSSGCIVGDVSSQWQTIDLMAEADGAPATLRDTYGGQVWLDQYSVSRLRVDLFAVERPRGGAVAFESHETVILTGLTTAEVRSDRVVDGWLGYAGWRMSVTTGPWGELRVTCDPARSHVVCAARVSWFTVYGVSP